MLSMAMMAAASSTANYAAANTWPTLKGSARQASAADLRFIKTISRFSGLKARS
jgi:hypothetical protein